MAYQKKGTIIRTHLWGGSDSRYTPVNLGRKSQNWRLSWPEGGGGCSEMLQWPNVGAGLTLEGITWETASSTEGGGGPVECGLRVLLMESELSFLQ